MVGSLEASKYHQEFAHPSKDHKLLVSIVVDKMPAFAIATITDLCQSYFAKPVMGSF